MQLMHDVLVRLARIVGALHAWFPQCFGAAAPAAVEAVGNLPFLSREARKAAEALVRAMTAHVNAVTSDVSSSAAQISDHSFDYHIQLVSELFVDIASALVRRQARQHTRSVGAGPARVSDHQARRRNQPVHAAAPGNGRGVDGWV